MEAARSAGQETSVSEITIRSSTSGTDHPMQDNFAGQTASDNMVSTLNPQVSTLNPQHKITMEFTPNSAAAVCTETNMAAWYLCM